MLLPGRLSNDEKFPGSEEKNCKTHTQPRMEKESKKERRRLEEASRAEESERDRPCYGFISSHFHFVESNG